MSEYDGNRDELVKLAKEKAESHWRYVERICHMMYVDAMIHGYVHGYQDSQDETKKRA